MVSTYTFVQWLRERTGTNMAMQAGHSISVAFRALLDEARRKHMESRISFSAARRLLSVAFALVAVAAQAAGGVSIKRTQEAAVRLGMNTSEVQQILGRPAEVFKYRSAPGPSWRYRIVESTGAVDFDVDFDSDGRVISAREHSVPTGG
jgi:hypothetical protein